MDFWTKICFNAYIYILRPIFKWFLHVVTGHSELERIIQGKSRGYGQIIAVENSLLRSRRSDLKSLSSCPVATVPSAVKIIVKHKYVSDKNLHWFIPGITTSLSLIMSYNELVREMEWLRKVTYDRQDSSHEQMLMELWNALQPTVSLKFRISKQWQDCGFQGEDPATDFRGMGILGLHQLLYFAKNQKSTALRLLSRSQHPTMGYPFAITGISMTSLCRDLLTSGLLKSHFYCKSPQVHMSLEDFHEVYCHVFNLFDQLWFEAKPENIMAFGQVRQNLFQQLTDLLTNCTEGVSLFG